MIIASLISIGMMLRVTEPSWKTSELSDWESPLVSRLVA